MPMMKTIKDIVRWHTAAKARERRWKDIRTMAEAVVFFSYTKKL